MLLAVGGAVGKSNSWLSRRVLCNAFERNSIFLALFLSRVYRSVIGVRSNCDWCKSSVTACVCKGRSSVIGELTSKSVDVLELFSGGGARRPFRYDSKLQASTTFRTTRIWATWREPRGRQRGEGDG